MQIKEDNSKRKGKYSQTCVKRLYKIRHMFGFEAGGCLLLHDSRAESSALVSCRNKQPPVKSDSPCHVNGWSLETGLTALKKRIDGSP